MPVLQAMILGLVQGLTEFIPISSSAHLIILPWLLNWGESSLNFDIALHLGTLTALIWFFAADWKRLIRAGFSSIVERKINGDPDRRLIWLLIIGCIPCGIVGILSESRIEQLFHQPGVPISSIAMIVMAVIIFLLGLALLGAEKLAGHTKDLHHLSLKDTIIVGITQALSIFPGVSRSGSTITGGLSIGLRREDAARFSFLLAAPIVGGVGLMSIFDITRSVSAGSISQSELTTLFLGFLISALSGYLCIKYLLRFLQNHSTHVFIYYRWILAAVVMVVALTRI